MPEEGMQAPGGMEKLTAIVPKAVSGGGEQTGRAGTPGWSMLLTIDTRFTITIYKPPCGEG